MDVCVEMIESRDPSFLIFTKYVFSRGLYSVIV